MGKGKDKGKGKGKGKDKGGRKPVGGGPPPGFQPDNYLKPIESIALNAHAERWKAAWPSILRDVWTDPAEKAALRADPPAFFASRDLQVLSGVEYVVVFAEDRDANNGNPRPQDIARVMPVTEDQIGAALVKLLIYIPKDPNNGGPPIDPLTFICCF